MAFCFTEDFCSAISRGRYSKDLWRIRDVCRRKGGVYEVRRIVPEAARKAVGKREFRLSLGTKSLAEAKLLAPAKYAKISAIIEAAREPPRDLSHREVTAVAANYLRASIGRCQDDPLSEAAVDGSLSLLQEAEDDGRAIEYLAPRVAEALALAGLQNVSESSRKALSERLLEAEVEFFDTMDRRA